MSNCKLTHVVKRQNALRGNIMYLTHFINMQKADVCLLKSYANLRCARRWQENFATGRKGELLSVRRKKPDYTSNIEACPQQPNKNPYLKTLRCCQIDNAKN